MQLPSTAFRIYPSSPLSDASRQNYFNDPAVATRAPCSCSTGGWCCLCDFQHIDVSGQQGRAKFADWNFPLKESKAPSTDITVKQTRKKDKGRNCFLATSVLKIWTHPLKVSQGWKVSTVCKTLLPEIWCALGTICDFRFGYLEHKKQDLASQWNVLAFAMRWNIQQLTKTCSGLASVITANQKEAATLSKSSYPKRDTICPTAPKWHQFNGGNSEASELLSSTQILHLESNI